MLTLNPSLHEHNGRRPGQTPCPAGRVLVIDDHPDVVRSLRAALESASLEVVFAYDGAYGLVKARDRKPDLIILDVMMPVMDGWSVLHALKQDPLTAAIPVLMLTVLGDDEDIEKSLALGARAHLVKPYDVEELIALVNRLIASEQPLNGLSIAQGHRTVEEGVVHDARGS